MAGLRLGILGGTFDPVHLGHLELAREARDALRLARVLFIPAGRPWRKAGRGITSDEHRVAMLREAVGSEAAYEVATLEVERAGPSYTVDTLETLRAEHPGAEMFFIIGEDALADLPDWVRPERILELAILAVARRAGRRANVVQEAMRRVPGLGERVIWLTMSPVEVSATEIRERVRAGLPIGDMVPAAVETYIRERGLYRE